MTKKRASSPMRQLLRLVTGLIIIVSIFLCLLAFLRVLHSQSKLPPSFFTSQRSHAFIQEDQFKGPPKVAFLFLVHRDLPLYFLWDTFFKNGDVARFSIYIHSEPGFAFDEVVWGESSMIEAERLLLEEALYDPANQIFALLSDSCVPLYNFSYIYNYVMSSPRSFVDSFVDVKGFRYDPKMSPTIPEKRWRKGSQWITLVRRHAEIVVDDHTVFPVFRKFCKRRPPIDLRLKRQLLTVPKYRNCISDEHYVQTLLAISGLEDELERRTLTYTSWNQSTIPWKRRSWHPITFDYADASPWKMREIKDIDHVYYECEQHTEFCHTGSKVASCYLFARKFTVGAAMRILREGLIGPYDVTAIPNM
ncbi:PREDICTED: Core-2/I-branching beta-1 [Prunus dulcis]|uniref:PREDICTED: Core-2/I-branching beta-1 n=1 Tax=Prunus dulcis TaxID=3755 RepID=A0A5E4EPI8_PRUDU|nr:PREDICTED: Core-2/I-branching beta-1 [Prunus dulcis]